MFELIIKYYDSDDEIYHILSLVFILQELNALKRLLKHIAD